MAIPQVNPANGSTGISAGIPSHSRGSQAFWLFGWLLVLVHVAGLQRNPAVGVLVWWASISSFHFPSGKLLWILQLYKKPTTPDNAHRVGHHVYNTTEPWLRTVCIIHRNATSPSLALSTPRLLARPVSRSVLPHHS